MTRFFRDAKGRWFSRSWKSKRDGRLSLGNLATLLMLALCLASALVVRLGPDEHYSLALTFTAVFFVATAIVGASAGRDEPPSKEP